MTVYLYWYVDDNNINNILCNICWYAFFYTTANGSRYVCDGGGGGNYVTTYHMWDDMIVWPVYTDDDDIYNYHDAQWWLRKRLANIMLIYMYVT